MAPGRRRFLQFNICGEKCAEQILLAGLTVQSARLTNLIQASLISVFFGKEKKLNSPVSDVFLQSLTLQYNIFEVNSTTEWNCLPPLFIELNSAFREKPVFEG